MEKYDVFISYSRKDKDAVDKVVNHLKNLGYSIWIDIDGIESGEAFRGVIVNAIENSDIVLFFSSESSNNSKWTTKEISLAVDAGKYIVPLKLDGAKYNNNLRFDLIDLDYIDLSEKRIYEASIQKLERTIANKIGIREKCEAKVFDGKSQTENQGPDLVYKNNDGIVSSLIQCWHSRNVAINVALCLLLLLAVSGFVFSFPYYLPASILGLLGLVMLFLNKKDGSAIVAASCFFWMMSRVYYTAKYLSIHHYFQNGDIIFAWLPLIVTILCGLLFLIKQGGKSWWNKCGKFSVLGVILLTLTCAAWIFAVCYDARTVFGLPHNMKFYINMFL